MALRSLILLYVWSVSMILTAVQAQAPFSCDGKDASLLHPDPESCGHFYYCVWGIIPFRSPCPASTLFNPEVSVCDWSKNVDCGQGETDPEGDGEEGNSEGGGLQEGDEGQEFTAEVLVIAGMQGACPDTASAEQNLRDYLENTDFTTECPSEDCTYTSVQFRCAGSGDNVVARRRKRRQAQENTQAYSVKLIAGDKDSLKNLVERIRQDLETNTAGLPSLSDASWKQAITSKPISRQATWPTFQFFNSENPEGEALTSTFLPKSFDINLPTTFVVHGFYTNSEKADWMDGIRDALFSRGIQNVVLVDWGPGADMSIWRAVGDVFESDATAMDQYHTAAQNTRVVGQGIADVIKQGLADQDRGLITCVGHSLGAHVCGFAGQDVDCLGKIIGMDPAGPDFTNTDVDERLSDDDAVFVQAIHTDTDHLGIPHNVGHVDFYPNGGEDQPGCITIVCDHGRAYELFIESIIEGPCEFISRPCTAIPDENGDGCSPCNLYQDCGSMGYLADTRPGRGTHWLRTTNNEDAFCQADTEVDEETPCEKAYGVCQDLAQTCQDGSYSQHSCGGAAGQACCLGWEYTSDDECHFLGGQCDYTGTDCVGGLYWSSMCGGPSNRQCCIPNTQSNDGACVDIFGTCQDISIPCPAGYETGMCSGTSSRKCCKPDPDWQCVELHKGTCQEDSIQCQGGYISNKCGGGASRRCCLPEPDIPPPPVNEGPCSQVQVVTRSEWGARAPTSTSTISHPLDYLFIHHTDGAQCDSMESCIQRAQQVQNYHMDTKGYSDIGYSFLIGGDGRAYEGRGWNRQGAHTLGYNDVGVAFSFIGNFNDVAPSEIMLNAARRLMNQGIQQDVFKTDFAVFGHRDTKATDCPGHMLYNIIQTWPEYGDPNTL